MWTLVSRAAADHDVTAGGCVLANSWGWEAMAVAFPFKATIGTYHHDLLPGWCRLGLKRVLDECFLFSCIIFSEHTIDITLCFGDNPIAQFWNLHRRSWLHWHFFPITWKILTMLENIPSFNSKLCPHPIAWLIYSEKVNLSHSCLLGKNEKMWKKIVLGV